MQPKEIRKPSEDWKFLAIKLENNVIIITNLCINTIYYVWRNTLTNFCRACDFYKCNIGNSVLNFIKIRLNILQFLSQCQWAICHVWHFVQVWNLSADKTQNSTVHLKSFQSFHLAKKKHNYDRTLTSSSANSSSNIMRLPIVEMPVSRLGALKYMKTRAGCTDITTVVP